MAATVKDALSLYRSGQSAAKTGENGESLNGGNDGDSTSVQVQEDNSQGAQEE